MTTPNLILLYVSDVRRSLGFWTDLLAVDAVETSDTFAMLPLAQGMMLGLWGVAGVAPTTATLGGGGEICIAVGSAAEVDATHVAWTAAGRAILQPPTVMDFGRTFTAADPDGHRIRVFAPTGA
ncbi:MAG: drug:proton antiporter [Hyphomicrobiales bacterium]|nr:drug:proton antiporter [Hyphomicrobiales bacterium]